MPRARGLPVWATLRRLWPRRLPVDGRTSLVNCAVKSCCASGQLRPPAEAWGNSAVRSEPFLTARPAASTRYRDHPVRRFLVVEIRQCSLLSSLWLPLRLTSDVLTSMEPSWFTAIYEIV